MTKQAQNGTLQTKVNEKATNKAASKSTTTEAKLVLSNDSAGVLKYTAMKDIPVGVQRLKDSFHKDQKTHLVQFRLNQLRNLYFALKDNADALCDALYEDFHRSTAETKSLELRGCLNDILYTMANLHKWVQPEKVTDLPIALATAPVYIERIPLGVVLIISPFNYPLMLSVISVVGALASGNAVVFKPTELTPHFSSLMSKILTDALDKDIFYVVNGGVEETTEVLNQKFDKIMYTGNPTVGKIIAKKAAETLTPVILELGGKSPAIILDDCSEKDLKVIARRILWGRFTNGGQTCVAVDYALVPKSIKATFTKAILEVMNEEFFSGLDEKSENYTHIIHDRAFNNLMKIIKTTKGEIIAGGHSDEKSRYIAPTVVNNVDWEDSTMKGEIFGPILPILEYSDLNKALDELITRHDTPLAQYIFTGGATSRRKNKQVDTILTRVRSGGTIVNDTLMHVALLNAPFGGIGQSGYGAYHGFFSFRSFTHERTTVEQALWNDSLMKARYPPSNSKKEEFLEVSMRDYNGKVWFGRTGNVNPSGPGSFFKLGTAIAGIATLGYYILGGL